MRFILRFLTAACMLGAIAAVAAAQDTGGVYAKDDRGITPPVAVKEVKPSYTAAAKRAGIQGVVDVAAVVREDGTVGEVKVTRSLDEVYGLDQQAVKAARQWQFKPGTKDGKAVPVRVAIQFTFTVR